MRPVSLEVADLSSQRFVITGCSGSGKSTLIKELSMVGEHVVLEPGRRVVGEEIRRGRDGVPWLNLNRFCELCARMAIDDLKRLSHCDRRTFFDRSFIDAAAAFERDNFDMPQFLQVTLATRKYAALVFMSEPWQELFRPDQERRHTFSDAVVEYHSLERAYKRFGYHIVHLPRASTRERVAFVLDTVSSLEPSAVEPVVPADVPHATHAGRGLANS